MTNAKPTSKPDIVIKGEYAPVDPAKLKSLIRLKGMNFTDVSKTFHQERATISRMVAKRQANPYHLLKVAEALGVSPIELQPSSDYVEPDEPIVAIPPPRNWKIAEFVRRSTRAANGLAYLVAKLENEHIPNYFSRGKFYELFDVPSMKRQEFVDRLVRHPIVCRMFKDSASIGRHLSVHPFMHDSAWWVLDEWIEGESLDEFLDETESISLNDIQWIALGILNGLAELHRSKVIFRELAPERVYVLRESSKIVLTDFELAKLGEGIPSVSGEWKLPNPYQAPEIGNYEPSVKVDLYSWAAIVCEMITGEPKADLKRLADSKKYEAIAKLLVQCQHPKPSARPESVESVRASWIEWKAPSK